jgi:hypothetical protein
MKQFIIHHQDQENAIFLKRNMNQKHDQNTMEKCAANIRWCFQPKKPLKRSLDHTAETLGEICNKALLILIVVGQGVEAASATTMRPE